MEQWDKGQRKCVAGCIRVISALVGALLLGGALMSGQTTGAPSLSVIDRQAEAIKTSTDAVAISPLIDSLFGCSLFSAAPKSFRDRLLATEVNFRTNHRSINNVTLVSAINAFATAIVVPHYSSAIPEQLIAIRLRLLKHFPNLLHPPSVRNYQALSPIGAFFLADILVRQKLLNPSFQVTPDQWFQQSLQPNTPNSLNESSSQLIASAEDPEVTVFLGQLQHELPMEGTPSAVALKQLFDGVGF